jgi:hypothetical protein
MIADRTLYRRSSNAIADTNCYHVLALPGVYNVQHVKILKDIAAVLRKKMFWRVSFKISLYWNVLTVYKLIKFYEMLCLVWLFVLHTVFA